MAKEEKKVILVIVEGPTDESALGMIFKEFFSDNNTKFHVCHGDITTQNYISSDEIVKKVYEQVEIVKSKYRYSDDVFLKIIHLTDTDGVFIQDGYVKHAEVQEITYYETHMESVDVQQTVDRNHRKAQNLRKLFSCNTIKDIPYKLYFNSCNLEHVLYGKLNNFSDEEKQEMADDFSERYEEDIQGFLQFLKESNAEVQGDYRETWKFIQKSLNSLNRHTNLHLVFEVYNKKM